MMNSRLVAALLLVVITGIGLAAAVRRRLRIIKDIDFLEEFMAQWTKLCKSKAEDSDAWGWCVENSAKMQRLLGPYGVMSYKPAFATAMIPNYLLITNTLVLVRDYASGGRRISGFPSQDAGYCYDATTTYSGVLKERADAVLADIRNPLVWFREGVRALLALPVLLLSQLGVFGPETASRIVQGGLFGLLSGLGGLVGLVSGAMTIILSWDRFSELVRRLLML
jgi:hypothetical protein